MWFGPLVFIIVLLGLPAEAGNAIGFLLFPIFCLKDGFSGVSPGKAMMGLLVINKTSGNPAGFVASLKRNLPLMIPFMVFVIDLQLRSGNRMGDGWANTAVISKKDAKKMIELLSRLGTSEVRINVASRGSGQPTTIKCSECSFENIDGLDYCDGCGAKLNAVTVKVAPGVSTELRPEIIGNATQPSQNLFHRTVAGHYLLAIGLLLFAVAGYAFIVLLFFLFDLSLLYKAIFSFTITESPWFATLYLGFLVVVVLTRFDEEMAELAQPNYPNLSPEISIPALVAPVPVQVILPNAQPIVPATQVIARLPDVSSQRRAVEFINNATVAQHSVVFTPRRVNLPTGVSGGSIFGSFSIHH